MFMRERLLVADMLDVNPKIFRLRLPKVRTAWGSRGPSDDVCFLDFRVTSQEKLCTS